MSFHLPERLDDSQSVIETIATAIHRLVLAPQLYPKILVKGLGNQQVTPDALDPLVIGYLNITAHLPEQSRPTVSAFVPGVMGVTGMETEKLIKGVVEETKPSLVIHLLEQELTVTTTAAVSQGPEVYADTSHLFYDVSQ